MKPFATWPAPTSPWQRHRFIGMSLLFHAALGGSMLWAASAQHSSPEAVAREERMLEASLEQTRARAVQDKLERVDAIRAALEQSLARQPSTSTAGDEDPQQRLRALERAIVELERSAQARELARLHGVSEDVARQRLPPAPPPAIPARPLTQPELAEQAAQLEQRAVTASAERRAQQDRAQNGIMVGQAVQQGEGGGRAVVFDKLAALTDQRVIADKRARLSTNWMANEERQLPLMQPGPLAFGSGQVIGQGGAYANRMLISGWHIIGPFPGGDRDAVTHPLPPELAVDLDAAYKGKDGRTVRWRYVPGSRYPIIPPGAEENAVYYGYAELQLDRARALKVWVGADDDARLWLNGRLVWTSSKGGKPWYHRDFRGMKDELHQWNLNEDADRLQFREGRNKLLFKLNNGIDALFMSLVLTPD